MSSEVNAPKNYFSLNLNDYLSSLPNEMLYDIIQRLAWKELFALRRTSKHLLEHVDAVIVRSKIQIFKEIVQRASELHATSAQRAVIVKIQSKYDIDAAQNAALQIENYVYREQAIKTVVREQSLKDAVLAQNTYQLVNVWHYAYQYKSAVFIAIKIAEANVKEAIQFAKSNIPWPDYFCEALAGIAKTQLKCKKEEGEKLMREAEEKVIDNSSGNNYILFSSLIKIAKVQLKFDIDRAKKNLSLAAECAFTHTHEYKYNDLFKIVKLQAQFDILLAARTVDEIKKHAASFTDAENLRYSQEYISKALACISVEQSKTNFVTAINDIKQIENEQLKCSTLCRIAESRFKMDMPGAIHSINLITDETVKKISLEFIKALEDLPHLSKTLALIKKLKIEDLIKLAKILLR